MPRKPRLTSKVSRGLRDIAALTSVELESGDAGAFAASNGGPSDNGDAAQSALTYIYALAAEFTQKQGKGPQSTASRNVGYRLSHR